MSEDHFRVSTMIEQCPACRGSSRIVHSRDYADLSGFLSQYYRREMRAEGVYEIRECETCGTLFQSGRPDDALLTRLYNVWLTEPPSDGPNERDRAEVATAQAFFGRKNLRTYDFGMGAAAWARSALEMGCESHGTDLSEHSMENAARHGVITDDDGLFDFINTEQVFEHMKDPIAIARELVAKLKPGGILKISVPAKYDMDLSGDPPPAVQPLEHLNTFTEQGLCRMTGLPMVRPSIMQRYARRPRRLKDVVRPFWTWSNRKNLHRWFQKPATEQ